MLEGKGYWWLSPHCIWTLHSSSPPTHAGAAAPAGCKERGTKWWLYRPVWRGCASWSFLPKPQSQHEGEASGHRLVRSVPSQRLPEERERKSQLAASSWLPGTEVKEQNLTSPPFPLKAPQARTCLTGGCKGRIISTLCFLLIWGWD